MTRDIGVDANITKIRVAEQTSVATPATGYGYIYAKADGLYFKGNNGTEIGPMAGNAADSYYNADTPPTSPSAYDDEFNDDTITGWTTPASDESFNMLQTNTSVHLSESIFHGHLLMQGALNSQGAYTLYKTFTPDLTQAFTVVAKMSPGSYIGTADRQVGIGIRGQADNVFYELKAGRCYNDSGFRTIYANGGAAAEGIRTNSSLPGNVYLMIVHDGSKNFSSFVSETGRSWYTVELNRNLSNLSSFSRLGLFMDSVTNQNGIASVDFIRYLSTAGQYKIGADV